jgi:serine protease Do
VRSLFRFLLLVIVLGCGLSLMRSRETDWPRRPPVDSSRQDRTPVLRVPRSGAVLPPPSARDPIVMVEEEKRRGPTVGSAFALHESGVWMTARHVVDGCSMVALRSPQGWEQIGVSWKHPRADMAVFRARGAPAHFALSTQPLTSNQDGFAIGFPRGRPGSVHGRLIGRTQMRSPNLAGDGTPSLAWAEVARDPDFSGSLGGISGGPLLESDGTVLGIIVAETPRRGRFETLAPEVVRAASTDARIVPLSEDEPTSIPINARDYGQVGELLRNRQSVAQVGCAIN